jgi:hypothetical protein
MQTSTKPYLYYEQIINGLVDVPKRIQKYLGDAIVLKNEQRRAAAEQKEAKALEIEPPPEDTVSNNTGLFKFPMFGWLSSLTTKEPKQESESESDNEVEVPLFDGDKPVTLSEKEPSDKVLTDEVLPSEKEPSEKEPSDKVLTDEVLPDESLSRSEEKICNIRNWQKLKVE